MDRFSIVGELLQMVRARRAWALIPLIVVLLFVGALVLLAEATPLGPLIYPLF